MGRLILYRESTPSDEKEFKQLINLQGPNITSEVQSDHKNEKRFTLIVHAGHKNETFDVSATYLSSYLTLTYFHPSEIV